MFFVWLSLVRLPKEAPDWRLDADGLGYGVNIEPPDLLLSAGAVPGEGTPQPSQFSAGDSFRRSQRQQATLCIFPLYFASLPEYYLKN